LSKNKCHISFEFVFANTIQFSSAYRKMTALIEQKKNYFFFKSNIKLNFDLNFILFYLLAIHGRLDNWKMREKRMKKQNQIIFY
jgi:hypothetical protein